MTDPISKMLQIAKILEDRFFYAENLYLKQELERLRLEEESVEELSKVSGIKNRVVLKELVARGIRPETLTALCLVPIIEVAWADGSIDDHEQKAILKSAAEQGLSENHRILQEWLKVRPEPRLMEAWKQYMNGICELMSKETLGSIRAEIVGKTRKVAESSGGILGLINTVSPAEQKVIEAIDSFFRQPGPCN